MLKPLTCALVLALPLFVSPAEARVQEASAYLGAATTPELCAQYREDRGSLRRLFDFPFSELSRERRAHYQAGWRARLDAFDFEGATRSGQVDWLLLDGELRHDQEALAIEVVREREVLALLPDVGALVALLEARSLRALPDAESSAAVLHAAKVALADFKEAWLAENEEPSVTPAVARRAAGEVGRLRRALRGWYNFSAGYDPLFTWWCKAPWEALDATLDDYDGFLEGKVGGIDASDEDLLLGDPIGRDALLSELRYERLAYSPEELIAMAEKEFAWCDARRTEAANAMGLDGDWRAAQEVARADHVAPGEQPEMIRDLADEAVDYLIAHELLRVPELAEESWRLGMMSPARQKFSPYFTGGEVISISYPTDAMDQDAKMQSMRGNNRHFSHATVFHELIPGHHLQGYMADRWAPHRGLFRTPFLVEGWALYWELRLWDMGFAQTPEDQIGMLFWRSHRAARIIFSLNFQLGNWSPTECVDFLVERVGHDRNNAEAEVRRSIQGGYGPLYQAAYLLGGMQMYALHNELVGGAGWSEPDFHEAVLRQNSIAPDLIRALLLGGELTREQPIAWRFPGVAR